MDFFTVVRMHQATFTIVLNLSTYSNYCFSCQSQPEKTKLRSLKWSFASFTKKSKTTEKSAEVPQLTKDGISQVSQLIKYLSKEESE